MSQSRRDRRAAEKATKKIEKKYGRRYLPIFPQDTPYRRESRMIYGLDLDGGKPAADVLRHALRDCDEIIAAAKRHFGEPACSAGCAYCCHVFVTIGKQEARNVAEHVRGLDTAKRDELRARIEDVAQKVAGTNADTYPPRQPCAFLEDNRCSIYELRPFACRQHHSLDADKCREAFELADNLPDDFGVPQQPLLAMTAMQSGMAFDEASAATSEGRQGSYELHQAVAILLKDESGDLEPAKSTNDPESALRAFARANNMPEPPPELLEMVKKGQGT